MKKTLLALLSVLLFCVASCSNLINNNFDNFSFTLGEDVSRDIKSSVSSIINEEDNVTVSCKITNFRNKTTSVTLPLKELNNAKISFTRVPYNKKLNLQLSVSYDNTYLYSGELNNIVPRYYNKAFNIILTPSTYSITYDTNGGTLPSEYVSTYSFNEGEVILPIPTKDGYSFIGWSENNNRKTIKSISKSSYGNKIFSASWKKNDETKPLPDNPIMHTVTFMNKGTQIKTIEVKDGERLTKDYLQILEDTIGYKFVGWIIDGNVVEENTPVTEDIILEAKWKAISYKITYHLNDGTQSSIKEVTYTIEDCTSENLTYTLMVPQRENFGFNGWYENRDLNGSAIKEITKETLGNHTYYASWQADSFNVTYISKHGQKPEDKIVTTGTNLTSSDFPVLSQEGYTFEGWYIDNQRVDNNPSISYPVTKNTTVSAQWALISYEITYHTYEGTFPDTVSNPSSYTIESEDIHITNPSKQSFTFIGWIASKDSIPVKDLIIPKGSTGNINLVACYEAISYSITYHYCEGAENTNPTSYQTNNLPLTLIDPTKEHYTFVNWYLDKDCTKVASKEISKQKHENLEFYAKWVPIAYSITYKNCEGAINNNVTKYNVEEEVILSSPTKTGFEFIGWTSTDIKEPNKTVKINKGSWGDKEFTANWKLVATRNLLWNKEGPTFITKTTNIQEIDQYNTIGDVGFNDFCFDVDGKVHIIGPVGYYNEKTNISNKEANYKNYHFITCDSVTGKVYMGKYDTEKLNIFDGNKITSVSNPKQIHNFAVNNSILYTATYENNSITINSYNRVNEQWNTYKNPLTIQTKRVSSSAKIEISDMLIKDNVLYMLFKDLGSVKYRTDSRGMIIKVDLNTNQSTSYGWTADSITQIGTIKPCTPSSSTSLNGFFGPSRIIGYSNDTLLIADEGLVLSGVNPFYYENINRIVTFDLVSFKISSVEQFNKTVFCEDIQENSININGLPFVKK